MSSYTDVKNLIISNIKANGQREITGPILQDVLLNMLENSSEADAANKEYVDNKIADIPVEKGSGYQSMVQKVEGNTAEGQYSSAFGMETSASGNSANAEGWQTKSNGVASHAEGVQTEANGNASHAEGQKTITLNKAEHTEGTWNLSIKDKTIHTVGIGSNYNDRKNAHEIHLDGKHYVYGIGGYDGTNSQTEGIKTVQEVVEEVVNAVQITYAELKSLRDAGKLVPGQQYRITDYTCTTTQTGTKSAGHVFDIIVTADDESTLNEVARAALHTGDEYFSGCNLSAWKVWYCLDNDANRFAWAMMKGKYIGVTDGEAAMQGRYVETKVINDITYDLWIMPDSYTYIGTKTLGVGEYCDIIYVEDGNFVVGAENFAIISDIKDVEDGKGVIYRMIDEFDNDCPYDFKNIQFYRQWNENKQLWSTISYGTAGVPCYTFSSEANSSATEFTDMSLILGSQVYYNIIKALPGNQMLNNNCFFGDGCNCNNFGNNCSNNTFGNSCYSNTFGDYCYNNAFGDDCYDNTFGNDCYDNTFGNDCYDNTFGNNFRNNTFGNYCSDNTFGNSCISDTFGDYCQNNTFGNNCSNNTFGNYCRYIKFASDSSSAATKYNYYQNNYFGDGCQYIVFTGAETASNSQQVQNYNFAQGLKGTSSVYLTIDGVRNRAYETYISRDTDGMIKESVIAEKLDKVIEISYNDLVTLRGSSKLVPGQQYRITDYTCTTTQANTKSAGHQFDIIVTADDESTLNEEARAALHTGDEYFSGCSLNAWKIWYCLDNDTTRFAWADSTNGKGVIYRMIDEWSNDVPYDFKNIQFARDWSVVAPDSRLAGIIYCYTFSVFLDGFIEDATASDESVKAKECIESDEGGLFGNNVIRTYQNLGVCFLNGIVFVTDWASFGVNHYSNTFGNNCSSNTLGNECYSNTFGNYCYSNTFGNECYSNTFGSNCYSNTFGNEYYSNTFGNYCYYNTFGNNCNSNTFGNDCSGNTFGNYCSSNTFGNNCSSNTFGNNCSSNTFGNDCIYIKFASDSSASTKYNYYQNNYFGDGCQYIVFTGAETASSAQRVQSYNFAQGLQGTRNAYLTIDGVRGRSFETYISKDTDGTIKESVIADTATKKYVDTELGRCAKLDEENTFTKNVVIRDDGSNEYPASIYIYPKEGDNFGSAIGALEASFAPGFYMTFRDSEGRPTGLLSFGGGAFNFLVEGGDSARIANIASPTDSTDAANKKYVDDTIKANIATHITYTELKSLRDAGKLVSGQQYRITDYTCTTTQTGTKSAGHIFDIIVTADDESTLNEEARAVKHEGDTYFANNDLSAWKIWYCLDNDTTRFAWADEENGKGVIYRMIDEFGNDCPYDFKNIQFKRYAVTNVTSTKLTSDALNGLKNTLVKDSNGGLYFATNDSYGNFVPSNADGTSYKINKNDSNWYYTFQGISSADGSTINKMYDLTVETFKLTNECISSLEGEGFGADTEDYCRENKIEQFNQEYFVDDIYYKGRQILNNIVFIGGLNYCYYNAADSYWEYKTSSIYGNRFGVNCNSNTFRNSCYSNTFGNDYYSNTFGNDCYSNTFGNNCGSNTFGNDCYSNTFGNNCSNNTFGNDCGNNTFGNNCSSNTFGNNCYSNTFGNGCNSNTFGNSYSYNTFGNSCGSNTFGNNCYSNTFIDDCSSNTFGNSCSYNTFGNNCPKNTFGNNCGSNTFGNKCIYIKFASDSSASNKYNYYQNNYFGDGCAYLVFKGTETASSSSQIQNYKFAQGLRGTEDSYLTIDGVRNLSYETKVAKNSNGEIKIYCEADLIL